MADSSKQRFPFQRSLSTIKTFEGDDDALSDAFSGLTDDAEGHGNAELVAVNQQVPSNILLVALLDHLSCLYIQDPMQSRQLFKVLVNQLVQHNVLPRLGSLDEISSLRSQYKAVFSRMVHAAITTINEQGLNIPKPSNIQERVQVFFHPRITISKPLLTLTEEIGLQTSRYREEFIQTGIIDSGAYGSVFKAENKLDRCEYAIKKIPFEGGEPEVWLKIMREVKVLAQLSHKNVVRYHNSWIEYTPLHLLDSRPVPSTYTADALDGSPNLPALTYSTSSSDSANGAQDEKEEKETEEDGDEEDDSIVFTDNYHLPARPNALAYGNPSSGNKPPPSAYNLRPTMEDLSTSSPSGEISPPAKLNFTGYKNGRQAVVLHIQMELCVSNLKEWLESRNSRLLKEQHQNNYGVVEEVENLCLLKHILKAVEFIHNNGLIHRDIKPKNIFLTPENTPKLGDFGLARQSCDLPFTPSPGMPKGAESSFYTTGIGTTLYAAPEQLTETVYDEKCDMYSVGIVIFELYHPFATSMERVECLKQLRDNRKLPPEFLVRWPKHAEYILQLLSSEARLRPSAREILRSELFLTKDQIISQLRVENQDQRTSIAQLQTELEERKKEIESLRLEMEYKFRYT